MFFTDYVTNFFLQAYCPSHTGRSEPSFGRKRREANITLETESNSTVAKNDSESNKEKSDEAGTVYKISYEETKVDKYLKDEVETPSHVRKMIEVSLGYIEKAFIIFIQQPNNLLLLT